MAYFPAVINFGKMAIFPSADILPNPQPWGWKPNCSVETSESATN